MTLKLIVTPKRKLKSLFDFSNPTCGECFLTGPLEDWDDWGDKVSDLMREADSKAAEWWCNNAEVACIPCNRLKEKYKNEEAICTFCHKCELLWEAVSKKVPIPPSTSKPCPHKGVNNGTL